MANARDDARAQAEDRGPLIDRAARRRPRHRPRPPSQTQRDQRRSDRGAGRLLLSDIPPDVRAAVIHGHGPNFSAGLDLSEMSELDVTAGVFHSRVWHRCFEKIEFGPIPVVAVLKGAVIGGGLELAAAAHVRVSEPSAFYALPEGQRGIFVGGGGSVRLPRLIGVARMADMMLTGRVLWRRGGREDRPGAISSRRGRRLRQGARARAEHGRQRAADQFRGDPGPAAHRRQRSARRLFDGIAGRRRRARRRRGEGPRARLSGKARGQDETTGLTNPSATAGRVGKRAASRRRACAMASLRLYRGRVGNRGDRRISGRRGLIRRKLS